MDGVNPLSTGKKTSEYRVTLIAQFISLVLVMTGVFAPEEGENLTGAIAIIVGGLMSIYSGSMYIYSRTSVKKEALKQPPPPLSESQRGV